MLQTHKLETKIGKKRRNQKLVGSTPNRNNQIKNFEIIIKNKVEAA